MKEKKVINEKRVDFLVQYRLNAAWFSLTECETEREALSYLNCYKDKPGWEHIRFRILRRTRIESTITTWTKVNKKR